MAAPKGTYGQPMQKAQRLMKDLTKKEDGLSQLAAVSQSPHLPNGTSLAPVKIKAGKLLRITSFTASGTWVKRSDVGYIIVELLGGGGGGGGSQGIANFSCGGASGAGGGGCSKYILASALGATEAVSIGAAGVGGLSTPTSGSQGGTTSFGAHCSASGGEGGFYTITSASGFTGFTALGGVGMGGDINFRGSPGFNVGTQYGSYCSSAPGGNGALPIGGPGARGYNIKNITDASAGDNADANSGGGGGGGVSAYGAASNQSGGTGGSGLCVVYEYSK